MAEWQKTTIELFCNKVADGTHDSPKVSTSGKPLVTSKNIKNGRIDLTNTYLISLEDFKKINQRSKVDQWDVLLSMIGTVGEVCVVRIPNPDFAIKNVGLLKTANKSKAFWLYYFLRSKSAQQEIYEKLRGSTQQYLPLGEIRSFPIAVPSDAERDAILDVLISLDDKIELNRQMNATLEATARALFKSWFVDFDPVRAKMEGRAPDGLSADIAALFPDTLVDSSFGEIPKGWEEKPMDQMIELIGGGTPKTSNPEYWDGDIPWFSVADTPSDTDVFVLDTEKHISKLGAENSSTKILPVGTTIVTARGTVGKLALVGAPMAMNQSCYGIRGINGDAYWTYFLCRRAVGDLQQRTHGSVFDTITRSTFSSIQVVSPSTTLIEAFDKTVAPILSKIRANLINNKSLVEIRDSLLPKLISGQLEVA